MFLEISPDEQRLLMELLDSRSEELQPEIRRCRNYRYRLDLKEEFDCVMRLHDRLRALSADAPATARRV